MLIRFKKNDGTEYPQWEEKKLGEICKVFAGGTPSTDKSEYWGTDILWIQSGLVQNCTIKPEDIKTSISKLGLSKSSAKMIKPNSVLLAMTGATCGNVGYLTCDACANQSVMAFEPFKDNAKFLYYLLINNKNYILNYQAGGAQAGVNKKSCMNFSFEFPCLEEQQKIADFLSTVDQKIEKQKAIVADYEELKKGTMQKIFNQEIRFKDDDGNEFPVWEEKRLEDLLIPIDKTPVDTSLYKKITVGLHKKGVSYNPINREMADKRPFYIRHSNELIIGKQNYFNGSIAIIPEKFDGCICSNAIMSFNHKDCNIRFLYERISEPMYLAKRYHLANGTGQKELSEKDFLHFIVELPCLEEQKKIADCLSALDRKIEAEKKILADLEELKKGLLQAIFNN